jgi:hypothetical protein
MHMGEMRNAYKILARNSYGKNHSKKLCMDGMIILKLILGKNGWGVWTGLMWL